MEERNKVTEKKKDSANIARLKGNRYFKAKSFDKALECYMDSLKELPFDAKTTNNIAQVFLFLVVTAVAR
jgi:tetratricopeptide (TPR) repeat protein